jgi:phosphoglycerate kinase
MAEERYFENRMTLKDVELGGKRVLIRVDFNVPLSEDGKVEDDFRIRSSLPTIRHVMEHRGMPILVSHLGRPKGQRVDKLSLRPVAGELERLLEAKVQLAPSCVGPEVEKMAAGLEPGGVLLLENSRFHPEEKANDRDFAARMAALADLFVNDAFGSAHRAHASTEGVTHHLQPAVAGFLMEKELEFLGKLLSEPRKPFIAVIGGAKISGKIEVLKNLTDKVDAIIVGGGIANTFLRAGGQEIGSSLFEKDALDIASEIMDLAKQKEVDFMLPSDFLAASEVKQGASMETFERGTPVSQGFRIVDIGARTVVQFIERIAKSSTIFWNGPMGVFEIEDFAHGTREIAMAVAAATSGGAVSVIGGGDTASAVARAGVADRMTHISTGGGASLEFVEGKELPGIASLTGKG